MRCDSSRYTNVNYDRPIGFDEGMGGPLREGVRRGSANEQGHSTSKLVQLSRACFICPSHSSLPRSFWLRDLGWVTPTKSLCKVSARMLMSLLSKPSCHRSTSLICGLDIGYVEDGVF